MPATTETAPENNKAKQTAYLVCDGALCQCDAGAAPVKLKVDSHKKAYINNNKLLATVKDIKFELPTAPFATCKNIPSQNKTCQPQFEKWTKPYKDIEVEGNQVITDKSELMCMAYGGKVTITIHGQQQTVNAGQAENMDRAIAAQVNSLADLAPLAEADKKVAVKSISGQLVDDPKYKPVTSQKAETSKSINKDALAKRKDDLIDIFVRPGQEVKFSAEYKGTESLVCWKIINASDPKYFLQHGSIYKTSFSEVGKYTIEGYGTNGDNNLDIETKIVENTKENTKKNTKETKNRLDDRTCMLDILVQDNKLTGIRHLDSDYIIDVREKGIKVAQVRVGIPVTFEPVYLMPPIQEEIDHLILVIKDASGNEVQRSKGAANIIFAAQNSAATYVVEASFDNSDATPFTYAFRTEMNAISVIAASGMKQENDKIRPGKTLTFSVKKYKFLDDDIEEEALAIEHEKIKWYENTLTPVGSGETYTKTYHREAEYTVKCSIATADKTWFSKGKNESDDWHFVVTNNYPTAIECKTTGKAKVGKKISFELKGVFAIDYSDESTITWKLTGPETSTTTRSANFEFIPTKNGTYTLTATMHGRSIELPIECITCEIVKGWWTDYDGNMLTGKDGSSDPSNTIGFAGWKQEVVAAFEHIGLGGEEVKLEVWDDDAGSDKSLIIENIKIPESETKGRYSFNLDETIQKEIAKNSLTSDGLLYFTIKATKGLKLINDGMVLPNNSDKYLKVNSTVRAKAYFSDNNDTKRYTTAALDTPVYIQVKSTNLIDEELEIEVWKAATLAYSASAIGKRVAFKVDKYGMASIKLNMDVIKPELKTVNDLIYVYVKIFVKKTGEELYLRSSNYMLKLYRKLATSASSIGTTKAFVVVDASDGEKKEYCSNCDKDITLEEIKKICVSMNYPNNQVNCLIQNDSYIIEALPFLNKYRKKVGINTCSSKTHFLAQISQESNFYNLEENFNYYWESLIETFGAFNTIEGKEKAKLWGRSVKDKNKKDYKSVSIENQNNIANWAYKSKFENGNFESGDGSNYRGRGFKQITWKCNYKIMSEYVNKTLQINKEFNTNWESDYLELTNNSRDAMISALAFWAVNSINLITDKVTNDSIKSVTKKINPALKGLSERIGFFYRAAEILELNQCKNIFNNKKVNTTYDNLYAADQKTAYINVIIPSNRKSEGIFVFFDESGILLKGYALAMGTTDKAIFIPEGKGSTPKGLWSSWYEKVHINDVRYGGYGLIKITGIDGDAKDATLKGRSGIAIHSGHTMGNPKTGFNDNGPLMVTYGCVRVYNKDMGLLVNIYNKLQKEGKVTKVYVEEVESMDKVFDFYNIVKDSKDIIRTFSSIDKQ